MQTWHAHFSAIQFYVDPRINHNQSKTTAGARQRYFSQDWSLAIATPQDDGKRALFLWNAPQSCTGGAKP